MSSTCSSPVNSEDNNMDKANNNNLNKTVINLKELNVKDKTNSGSSSNLNSINIIENNSYVLQIHDQNISDNLNQNLNINEIQSLNYVPTSLPPTYWDVPGTVPISAGTVNRPPPTYEEVINPNVPPPTYQSLFGQVQNARKSAKTFPDLIKNLIFLVLGTIGLTVLIAFTVLIPFTMILVGASNLNNCRAENIPMFLLVGGIVWILKNLSHYSSQCSNTTRELERTRTQTRANTSSNNNNTITTVSNTVNSNNNNDNIINNNSCDQTFSQTHSSNNSSNSSNSNNSRLNLYVINLHNERTTNGYQSYRSRRSNFLINLSIFIWFLTGCIMVYRIFPPNYVDHRDSNYCDKTVYMYAFLLLTSIFIIFGLFVSCICCISITALFSSNSEINI